MGDTAVATAAPQSSAGAAGEAVEAASSPVMDTGEVDEAPTFGPTPLVEAAEELPMLGGLGAGKGPPALAELVFWATGPLVELLGSGERRGCLAFLRSVSCASSILFLLFLELIFELLILLWFAINCDFVFAFCSCRSEKTKRLLTVTATLISAIISNFSDNRTARLHIVGRSSR